jgi:hypothetical protein
MVGAEGKLFTVSEITLDMPEQPFDVTVTETLPAAEVVAEAPVPVALVQA